MSRSRGFLIVFACMLLTAACVRGGHGGRDGDTGGAPEWPSVSPAAAGLDPQRLDEIAAQAKKGKSNCLAVIRNGKLAREWYFRGTGPEATGHSSTRLNAAYGYLWWLNRPGTVAGPLSATDLGAAGHPTTIQGPLVRGAPQNMFWALGLGNQLVQVDPGSRTVVVRLGTAEPRPRPPTFGPAEAAKVVTEAVVHRS